MAQVKFLINETDKDSPDLFAFFPNLRIHTKQSAKALCNSKSAINNLMDLRTCYSRIGQHSACCSDYVNESREATREEYISLKTELESIGYKLKVLNKN